MSETVKWSALTPEERDRLVAEKVMDWKPGVCNGGEMLEQGNSSDGWYCSKCGYQDCWSEDFEHDAIPPSCSTMHGAWEVVECMVARMGWQGNGFKWYGPLYKPEDEYISSIQHSPTTLTWHFDYTKDGGFHLGSPCWYVKLAHDGLYWWFLADTPQEAICIAALRVCGVEVEP